MVNFSLISLAVTILTNSLGGTIKERYTIIKGFAATISDSLVQEFRTEDDVIDYIGQ
jgi:hypothetical protein